MHTTRAHARRRRPSKIAGAERRRKKNALVYRSIADDQETRRSTPTEAEQVAAGRRYDGLFLRGRRRSRMTPRRCRIAAGPGFGGHVEEGKRATATTAACVPLLASRTRELPAAAHSPRSRRVRSLARRRGNDASRRSASAPSSHASPMEEEGGRRTPVANEHPEQSEWMLRAAWDRIFRTMARPRTRVRVTFN